MNIPKNVTANWKSMGKSEYQSPYSTFKLAGKYYKVNQCHENFSVLVQ